ncbi:MAG: hypothetical protein AB8I08_26670 [Sandaracinaceae bacterium]
MFQHASRIALATLLVVSLTSCGDDRGGEDAGTGSDGATPSGPSATLSWQMRCDTEPCPEPPSPARTLDATDGEAGHTVDCDLTIEGEDRRMNLTARLGDQYGIEVRGARIGLEGGRLIGSLCQIRVFEEADLTVFEPCQASHPSPDRACQFQRIDIRDIEGVPTLTGEFRCVGAQSEMSETRVRDVSSPDAAGGNVEFAFRGCAGL